MTQCASSTLSANAGTPAIGGQCRNTAMKNSRFCYWHKKVREVHGHTCTGSEPGACAVCAASDARFAPRRPTA